MNLRNCKITVSEDLKVNFEILLLLLMLYGIFRGEKECCPECQKLRYNITVIKEMGRSTVKRQEKYHNAMYDKFFGMIINFRKLTFQVYPYCLPQLY